MRNRKICIILILTLCASTFFGCGGKSEQSLDELLSLGQKYLQEENYEEAIVTFEKAIKIDDKCVEAYIGLANAYVGTGDLDKAIEILEQGYKKTSDKFIGEYLKNIQNNSTDLIYSEGEIGNDKPEIRFDENNTTMRAGQILMSVKSSNCAQFAMKLEYLPDRIKVLNDTDYQTEGLKYLYAIHFSDGENIGAMESRYRVLTDGTETGAVDVQASYMRAAVPGTSEYIKCEIKKEGDYLIWTVEMPEGSFDLNTIRYAAYEVYDWSNGTEKVASETYEINSDGIGTLCGDYQFLMKEVFGIQ